MFIQTFLRFTSNFVPIFPSFFLKCFSRNYSNSFGEFHSKFLYISRIFFQKIYKICFKFTKARIESFQKFSIKFFVIFSSYTVDRKVKELRILQMYLQCYLQETNDTIQHELRRKKILIFYI